MIEIIPAILADNFTQLHEEMAKVAGIVPVIQIDVCDGMFVKAISWPYNEIRTGDSQNVDTILSEEQGLPFWDSIDFEFDLMVRNAHEQFELFTRLGAKRLVFHIEAEGDLIKFKEFLESIDLYVRENIHIGVAINTNTSTTELGAIISNIDFIQCMGIEHIGSQGEPFDERVISQVKTLRALYPELIISVDGSVNEKTAPLLVEAGANRLVVGSAIMNSYDIRETISELQNL